MGRPSRMQGLEQLIESACSRPPSASQAPVSRADVACRGRMGVAMAGRPALRGPSHRSRKQKRLGSARRLFCTACRRGRRHDVVATPDEPPKARSGASWRPSEKATWFEAPASGPEARGPESRRSTRDGSSEARDRSASRPSSPRILLHRSGPPALWALCGQGQSVLADG